MLAGIVVVLVVLLLLPAFVWVAAMLLCEKSRPPRWGVVKNIKLGKYIKLGRPPEMRGG